MYRAGIIGLGNIAEAHGSGREFSEEIIADLGTAHTGQVIEEPSVACGICLDYLVA